MSYAVLNVKTGLYYNPSKPGNRRDPTFHKKPKLYSKKGHAERALAFCRSGVNDHWRPATTFVPINCELVEFTDPQPKE